MILAEAAQAATTWPDVAPAAVFLVGVAGILWAIGRWFG